MKKCYFTALASFITGCAQQTFTVQNKLGSRAIQRKPSPIISSLNLAEEINDGAKICGGAENEERNRNPANIRKMDCSVLLLLGIYTPLEARVLLTHWLEATHR